MLLRQLDRRIGLSKAVAHALSDSRDPERITHPSHLTLPECCSGHDDKPWGLGALRPEFTNWRNN